MARRVPFIGVPNTSPLCADLYFILNLKMQRFHKHIEQSACRDFVSLAKKMPSSGVTIFFCWLCASIREVLAALATIFTLSMCPSRSQQFASLHTTTYGMRWCLVYVIVMQEGRDRHRGPTLDGIVGHGPGLSAMLTLRPDRCRLRKPCFFNIKATYTLIKCFG